MIFDVILADPPWKYNSRANHKTRFRGGASGHYNLLTMQEIKDLDVKSVCSENAILFLWCTFPYLKDQLEVFKAWGFQYKTVGFTWVKTNIRNNNPFFGVGYYTKSNAEICLLGTRGKVMKPTVNTVSSIVIAPRLRHSAKPKEVHKRIELLYPEARKLELFGRSLVEGWTVLGNEIDGKDIREALSDIRKYNT